MSIIDSLKALSTLPAALEKKALEPVDATSKLTKAIDTAAENITKMDPARIEKRMDEATRVAEIYFGLTLAFQALASFAALGMLVVNVKTLNTIRERGARRRRRRDRR